MSGAVDSAEVDIVRGFGRFYTRLIGLLDEGLLESRFTLPQARVLYEVARSEGELSAARLARELALDPGYLSRLLGALVADGLVERPTSAADRRQSQLLLTEAGQAAFAELDRRSTAAIAAMLVPLTAAQRARLVAAMRAIETLLGRAEEGEDAVVLRPHAPGDMGWIVERHGALYAAEHGWDGRFEALVAGIAKDFLESTDDRRRAWIAEHQGRRVGSVVVVGQSAEIAQLRLLLVEPDMRGRGVARRLVMACEDFARQMGYRRLCLWTNDVLIAARKLYESRGFVLTSETPHQSFGHDLTAQTWELELARP